MITINKNVNAPIYTIEGYKSTELIYFDIETTGFVADKSYLYLIGCCYYKESSWKLIQWFAQNPSDEINLLHAFIEFISMYSVCLHYNGNTFDIPYITRKCTQHGLDYSFQNLYSIDLYKTACSLKKLLHLNSCTQKAMERTLGINREDIYSGGDLIQVYANYVGMAQLEHLREKSTSMPHLNNINQQIQLPITNETNPVTTSSKELLDLLLLHNEDDLCGLIHLTSLLTFDKLLAGHFDLSHMSFDSKNCLCYAITFKDRLPTSFDYMYMGIEFSGKDYECQLKIPLKEGTLRYYMDNYKDYYYLPLEDTIIHKSIASSVDKEYRKKATRDNCYLKKLSIFLPQFTPLRTPCFVEDRKDSISYIECDEELLKDLSFQKQYICHIITACMKARSIKR